MKPIKITTIPYKKMRYPTVGDYWDKNGTKNIVVAKMRDDYEFLVSIHELIEFYLCDKHGINEKYITKFDIKFEKDRELGFHGKYDEPGFDKNSPYLKEHIFADKIEKMLAEELGINWKEYEEYCNNL